MATDFDHHPLEQLLLGAWLRRNDIRLADALYVELAERLRCPLLTTDRRLASAAAVAEYVGPRA